MTEHPRCSNPLVYAPLSLPSLSLLLHSLKESHRKRYTSRQTEFDVEASKPWSSWSRRKTRGERSPQPKSHGVVEPVVGPVLGQSRQHGKLAGLRLDNQGKTLEKSLRPRGNSETDFRVRVLSPRKYFVRKRETRSTGNALKRSRQFHKRERVGAASDAKNPRVKRALRWQQHNVSNSVMLKIAKARKQRPSRRTWLSLAVQGVDGVSSTA